MYCYYFKLRSVFLVGFGIGFLVALIFFGIQNTLSSTIACKKSLLNSCVTKDVPKWFVSDASSYRETVLQVWKQSTVPSNTTYNKWLERQKVRIKDIDVDAYLYGPERREKTEADWLSSNVHLTCAVFVKKIKLAKSIQDTWGKRCNRLYFFSKTKVESEIPIVTFEMKFVSSWQLLCEAFNYIWKQNEIVEWLIFVNDDTLVIPENLRYALSPMNHTQDHYLGHAIVMWGQPYNVASAGYVISVGVLERLIKMFDSSQKCLTGGKYWKQEDYYLAKHLASMGIYPSDTRDQYFRGTFHGYSLEHLLWGVLRSGAYWSRAMYPTKNECCSLLSVTFSVGDPDKMYMLNYLLYHLRVSNGAANFGKKKAATSVPDEDVWKIALKEEFNITQLYDISNEAYYNIWHAKYSKPGQLFVKSSKRVKVADKPARFL